MRFVPARPVSFHSRGALRSSNTLARLPASRCSQPASSQSKCTHLVFITIRMSSVQAVQVSGGVGTAGHCLESVSKISQIPVVESTIGLASDMYKKVKDSNAMVSAALGAAETTAQSAVNRAVEVGRPVAARLQGPIQRVDSALCTGIDYVESKVPAVMLQPREMYERVVGAFCSVCGAAMQKLNGVGQFIGKTASAAAGDGPVRAQCSQCAEAQAEREKKLTAVKKD